MIDLFYQGLLASQFLELLNSSASGAKRDSGTNVNAALAINPKHPRWLNHLLPKVHLSFHLSFLQCALGWLFELLWKFFEKRFRSYEFIPVKGESTDSNFKTWELHHTSTTKDRDLDLVDIIGLSHRKKLGKRFANQRTHGCKVEMQ